MKTISVYVIITLKYYEYQTVARFKVRFPFFILLKSKQTCFVYNIMENIFTRSTISYTFYFFVTGILPIYDQHYTTYAYIYKVQTN